MKDKLPPISYVLAIMFLALLFVLVFTATLHWLTSLTGWNFKWIEPGVTISSLFLAIDLVTKYRPAVFSWEPLFTNFRDTMIIFISLLIASVIIQIPKLLLYDSRILELLAYILGILIAFVIMYLGGTNSLKKKVRW
jgi:hypothetical protein